MHFIGLYSRDFENIFSTSQHNTEAVLASAQFNISLMREAEAVLTFILSIQTKVSTDWLYVSGNIMK